MPSSPHPLPTKRGAMGALARRAPQNLGLRENRQFQRRAHESARSRRGEEDHPGGVEIKVRRQLPKPLPFPLVGAGEGNRPTVRGPGMQLVEKPVALGFVQHQIPGGEIAERRWVEFDRSPILCGRGKNRATLEPILWLDLKNRIRFLNVVPQRGGGRLAFSRKNLQALDRAHRALRVDIELPHRLDLHIEPLEPHGTRLLPGEHIHDPAPTRKLPASSDGRRGNITRRPQPAFDVLDGDFFSAPKFEQTRLQGGFGRRGGIPLRRVDHHHLVSFFHQRTKQIQTLGLGLGIRQRLFAGNLQVRKQPHLRAPSRQLRGEFLLAFEVAAHHPHATCQLAQPKRCDKRLRGLSNAMQRPRRLGEFHRAEERINRRKFHRNTGAGFRHKPTPAGDHPTRQSVECQSDCS